MTIIRSRLLAYGVDAAWAELLAFVILIGSIALVCLIANFITQKILVRLVTHILRKHRYRWDEYLLRRKVFRVLSHLVPAMIIYWSAAAFPTYRKAIETAALTYLVAVTLVAISRLLSVLNDIYQTYDISKTKPIKGYIQVAKLVVIIVGIITVIARWMGESPAILLSGIAGLSAVFLLVFRDSLLGLVAGIQLSANDMVRVGDWIEMPNYEANGEVIDISLNTVMVQNFDRTVTMIPSYALISSSFKNWRGMLESGGRRLMRSLSIDMTSIRFCTPAMIDRFRKIDILTDYIESREKEITAYNDAHGIQDGTSINGRALTNIGVFRVYIIQYLRNHPDIDQEAPLIARQLASGKDGLPIEIYAFAKTTEFAVYETIQADIFDHLFAVIGDFGLELFQSPTGRDLKQISPSATDME
ncbi:mechanosensitive ion channel family protein [Sporosarcina trichiuri]|uniref:mechanosensitive ion channel family protein n=1 Tax=Sporosarcina trichiuri TaxID=3056445 RepID=UPI0025B458EC|nr:mechanosensitive ion channel domain-containing protein [Sporosarcina sp. 0.2-SM1T-5]WJY27044.1 mechanosensitive ion channel [Sporosarcina sp. 0.2-SM1T-5]